MTVAQQFLVPPKLMIEQEENHASSDSSIYELIIHPNEEDSFADRASTVKSTVGTNQQFSWKSSGFLGWFATIDEMYFKPFFIRNYEKVKNVTEGDDDFHASEKSQDVVQLVEIKINLKPQE